MAITSLNDIKKIANPEIEISGWNKDKFTCKLRRISMLDLLSKGKIPNSLLGAAQELFEGKKKANKDDNIKEIAQIIDIFVQASLVEPSLKELESVGVSLTDTQKIDIFNYCTQGVQNLTPSNKK